MATTIITKKWIFLAILCVAMKHDILIQGQQQVPCLYFFGDSQFDNGNNNGLATTAKVNYPPYGIDYPGQVATGRFSNGQNIADYLAQLLGFNTSIPPYVTTQGSGILQGLNYASGAAGILDASGARYGNRFTMNEQLVNHQVTIIRLLGLLRSRTAVNEYLRRCLTVVNMGSNDYINNYYLERSVSSRVYTPDKFAEVLIEKFSRQLRKLYDAGSRKIAVFGLGLLGCIPQELVLYPPTNGAPCVDFINNAVGLFNYRLVNLINQLNRDYPTARFTYINITSMSLGNLSDIGIRVLNAPCCQVQSTTGQCVPNGNRCDNRFEYAFWDNFHPTEILNFFTAFRSYSRFVPTDASPVDIQTLANIQL